jgi:hypothetical protein
MQSIRQNKQPALRAMTWLSVKHINFLTFPNTTRLGAAFAPIYAKRPMKGRAATPLFR